MNDNVEDLTELRLWSLEKIRENKAKVVRTYNKMVKLKEFQVGDLVWEALLPSGTKDAAYGKWSLNWHGPYIIDQVLPRNAYMLEELDGVKFPTTVNISSSIFPACGMMDIEYPMMHIRLNREGGRYVESANIKKGKEKKEEEKEKKKRKYIYNSR
jgi:hypothetical protein